MTEGYAEIIGGDRIARCLNGMANNIAAVGFKPDVVIGVLAGGAPMTVDLTRALAQHGIYPQIKYVELKRVADEHKPSGFDIESVYWPITDTELHCKKVLVIDDVLDSGATLVYMWRRLLQQHDVLEVRFAVAVDKCLLVAGMPGFQADWALVRNEKRWLIGYGMDDEKGERRNLPGIHAKL